MSPRAVPALALPRERSSQWVYGWKAANLLVHKKSGEIKFAPFYQWIRSIDPLRKSQPYGVSAEAKCQYYLHKSPHKPDCWCKCECGFYAVDTDHVGVALDYMRRDVPRAQIMTVDNPALLYVGLKGLMYQGHAAESDPEARITRAAFQQVTGVFLPKDCAGEDCFEAPVALGVRGDDPKSRLQRNFQYLRPLCHRHRAWERITLEECSRRLKVSVTWYDPLTRVI